MPPRKLASKKSVSEMAGVTVQAIAQAILRPALKHAMVGDKIDLDHDDTKAYLERAKARKRRKSGGSEPEADISRYMEMTLADIITRFGTVDRFKSWLVAAGKIAALRERQLNVMERKGELLDREYVRQHVIGLIDAANRRLLRDVPRTVAARVMAAARAGTSIEDCEATVRDILESQLRPLRDSAVKAVSAG